MFFGKNFEDSKEKGLHIGVMFLRTVKKPIWIYFRIGSFVFYDYLRR